MRILFNDEPMSCDDGLTVAALLDMLRQLKPGTALALNQQILPREQWEHQQVNACTFDRHRNECRVVCKETHAVIGQKHADSPANGHDNRGSYNG